MDSNNINELAQQIDKYWAEYYNFDGCKYCVGNGCDDCRDCDQKDYKSNLMKRAINTEKYFKDKFNIEYKYFKDMTVENHKLVDAASAHKTAINANNQKILNSLIPIINKIVDCANDGKFRCEIDASTDDTIIKKLNELGYKTMYCGGDPRDPQIQQHYYEVRWD